MAQFLTEKNILLVIYLFIYLFNELKGLFAFKRKKVLLFSLIEICGPFADIKCIPAI